MKNKITHLLLLMTLLSVAPGCSKFFGGLRKDLDDSEPMAPPTYGGRWTERGLLSESMPEDGNVGRYDYMGHMERNPASSALGETAKGRSWVNQDAADANHRDRYRGMEVDEEGNPVASFSNTPNMEPPVKRAYKRGARATRSDFIDESPNEGSLWASDGQTNYYFTKNKVRGVGDIVTITVEPELLRDVYTEARKTLTPAEKEAEIALAQERMRNKFLGIQEPDTSKDPNKKNDALATSSAAPARTLASNEKAPAEKPKEIDESQIPVATAADIDVSKSLDIKAGDFMMGEIVERYPNGNYMVRAVKRVPYKKGPPRMVSLVGIARGTDIGEGDDAVASGKLYEYRIEALR